MNNEEYEFILFDRIEKIKQIYTDYDLENTSYVSFSGGKDSTVISYLLDMAVPNNKIPRVYKDTGIEYRQMRKHVRTLATKDNRIIYIKPDKNIKQTLERVGYPFKSKGHSQAYSIYRNNIELCDKYIKEIENKSELLTDYEYISNLPNGVSTVIKYYFGVRTDDSNKVTYTYIKVPKILKYQFKAEYARLNNYSDKCCLEFKKAVLREYERTSKRFNAITGMRKAEGGNRTNLECITSGVNGLHFNLLLPVSDEWVDMFIKENNVELCELYLPPYNYRRTGCLMCPYALDLQEQLDTAYKIDKPTAKQAELIWGKVYKEYREKEYRLRKLKQLSIFDLE